MRPSSRSRTALVVQVLLVVGFIGLLGVLTAWGQSADEPAAAPPATTAPPVDVPTLDDHCVSWVSVSGSDDHGTGSEDEPWASITHAVRAVDDLGCTILVGPGRYDEGVHIDRRFDQPLTIRSAVDHRAELVNDSTVFKVNGAKNVVLEGFRLRHDGPGSTGYVAIVDRRKDNWARNITFRNNILHDSYENDLLKVHNGAHEVLVEGNVFYNQGPSEQHIDVNSAVEVTIQDNIFFNDFARSGREVEDSKAFIVVKDSGGDTDGNLGARDITIQRNVFTNWEGGRETLLQVGNDGKPYHEAIDVLIENNLFTGATGHEIVAVLGVRGVKDVAFNANTVSGDFPGRAFALWINVRDDNEINEGVSITNNIWHDTAGTMSRFSVGSPDSVEDLVLERNLYWNAGRPIRDGQVAGPGDDPGAVIGHPRVGAGADAVTVPYWDGSAFLSGATAVRAEFVRLVETHGAPGPNSAVTEGADLRTAPATDILDRPRKRTPDLGAYELPE